MTPVPAVLLGLLSPAARSARPPNIVLIMADDLGWETIGCYGSDDYQTPRLDQMAARGIRFEHCYSTPICTTSRVMIMTGRYNFRNYTHFGYLSPHERTFGHLLKEAGYATAIAGKWQLNGLYNKLDRHDDGTRPLEAGFDTSLLWQVTKQKSDGGERFWSPRLERDGTPLPEDQTAGKYGPDLFADFLCEFMSNHKNQPFFAYYPMVLTHSPFVPTPDNIGDRPRDSTSNKSSKTETKENFAAMLNYTDKIVGRLVDHADDLGIAENTLFLFTGDNGTSSSIHSQWNGIKVQGGKGSMPDIGTHVPLVAYRKGVPHEGAVLPDLVDFSDFYPTFAELAGIELTATDPRDGRSFAPQLSGRVGNPRAAIFCHYQCYWKKTPGQFARTADYKLYADGRLFAPASDLSEQRPLDPETVPLATRSQLQAILDKVPPVPTGMLDRSATPEQRPTHPEWPVLPSSSP